MEEVEAARDALRAMLKEGASPPDGRFATLAALSPVRDYPARHASTMLAFEAAAAAAREAADGPLRLGVLTASSPTPLIPAEAGTQG